MIVVILSTDEPPNVSSALVAMADIVVHGGTTLKNRYLDTGTPVRDPSEYVPTWRVGVRP